MNPIERNEYLVSTLKGIFGAIPFAGTFINEIVFEARSRIKQNRINNFIHEFSEFMDKETEDSVKLDSVNKEEFGDIFEELIISVSKTSAKHKIKIFKGILAKQFKGNSSNVDQILRYVQITNSINSLQFRILITFNSLSDRVLNYKVQILGHERELVEHQQMLQKEREISKKGLANNVPTFENRIKDTQKAILSKQKALRDNLNPSDPKTYEIPRDEFLIEIHDLISKGLVFDQTITSDLLKPNENFGLTKLGRDYIKYVEESKDEL
jgi:hypothetical protein